MPSVSPHTGILFDVMAGSSARADCRPVVAGVVGRLFVSRSLLLVWCRGGCGCAAKNDNKPNISGASRVATAHDHSFSSIGIATIPKMELKKTLSEGVNDPKMHKGVVVNIVC